MLSRLGSHIEISPKEAGENTYVLRTALIYLTRRLLAFEDRHLRFEVEQTLRGLNRVADRALRWTETWKPTSSNQSTSSRG